MPNTYGQFCPISKAMELLDERWTMLVVRELVLGSRTFNDLRRGVPRMSPTLLSKRLQTLARAGVVDRRQDGNRVVYSLTPAGVELESVVMAIGRWGTRWINELGDGDLDPHLLVWDIHRNVDLDAVPDGRTVLRLRFTDVPAQARDWWIVVDAGEVDVCDHDPGFDVRITLESSLRTLTRLWRGDIGWREAVRSEGLRLLGDPAASRAVSSWLRLSPLASVERPQPVA